MKIKPTFLIKAQKVVIFLILYGILKSKGRNGVDAVSERSNCLQGAIDYIEENLCDDLKIENIASRAFISPFYFQKIFSAVCNITTIESRNSKHFDGKSMICEQISL